MGRLRYSQATVRPSLPACGPRIQCYAIPSPVTFTASCDCRWSRHWARNPPPLMALALQRVIAGINALSGLSSRRAVAVGQPAPEMSYRSPGEDKGSRFQPL